MATMLIDVTRETFVFLCNHLQLTINDRKEKLRSEIYLDSEKECFRKEISDAKNALQELYGKREEGDKKDGALCF